MEAVHLGSGAGQGSLAGPLSNPWLRLGAVLSWDWVLSKAEETTGCTC